MSDRANCSSSPLTYSHCMQESVLNMSDDIRITGEPLSVPSMCRFIVDRPIYENRSWWFGSKAAAESSPLPARIFEIPGIAGVLISHQTLTVTKFSPEPWPVIGKAVGAAIRAQLATGEPCVNPSLHSALPPTEELRRRVETIIREEVAPSVAQHGGNVSVVDVRDNVVMLKLGGGCQGCSSATATLKFGVEAAIRRAVPEIGDIIDTTDHTSGANPYYRSGTA